MRIRNYEPGDEEAQARIFNMATQALPGFKPATAEEIARRYRTNEPDASARFYVVDETTGAVVGYALFNPNGRVCFPWCLPGSEAAREPLLAAVLAAMADRGLVEAWAAYRADWLHVIAFFRQQRFGLAREMVNFVAETAALPAGPVPDGLTLGPFGRDELPRLVELGGSLFEAIDLDHFGAFLLENQYFGPDSLFALRDGGRIVGMGLAIASTSYADPIKLDAAMPCFRLGALGTERERHKRVSGMVSCVFTDETVGEALLAVAARRFRAAGLAHSAAQAPSDRPDLIAFYERYFRRQGAFPILSRRLNQAG
jgi:hypothetical protein